MTNFGRITVLSLALIMLLFISCVQKEAPSPQAVKPGEIPLARGAETEIAMESWKQRWDKTLEEAKKERRVVIYAFVTAATHLKEAINLFKEKYGLDLEIVSFGRGAEQQSRFYAERARGLYLADVFISGMNTTVTTKQRDTFDPLEPALILPEVLDPKLWFGGQLPWGDKERKLISYALYPVSPMAINTQIEPVKPEDIKSYYELLAPKWKGKIVVNDPTTAGTAFNGFSSLILNKALDLDYFRQLVKQEPIVLRDQRLQVDWLAKGKYPLALWPRTPDVIEYQGAGAPLAFIPVLKEGFYLATGGHVLALVNFASHPNAARVFINWLLSREGLKQMQNSLQIHSAREDISTEGVDPLNMRRPGEKYLLSANASEDWILNEQDRYMDMAKQVFARLVR